MSKLYEVIFFVVTLPITVPVALIGAIALVCTVRSFCKGIEGDKDAT